MDADTSRTLLLADIRTLARTSAPLRTVVDTNAATPRLRADAFAVVDSARDPARSHQAVRTASQPTASCTAEAFLSLAAEAESWG